jgi:multidrug efflux pump subunit AcrB
MRTILLSLLLVPFAVGCAGSAPPAGADGPVIRVTASYPGANAKTVSDTVVAPIAEQINGVEGMVRLESESRNDGSCIITVRFKPKTDADMAQVLVQNRVSLALPVVPAICQKEGITVRKSSDRLPLWVAVTSPDGTHDTVLLATVAEKDVKDKLLRVVGVMNVRAIGASDSRMRVWLDPDKLAGRDLSAMDVVKAIEGQNLQVAAGEAGRPPVAKGQTFPLTIESLGRLGKPEEFGNIILNTGADGKVIRLKDVAKVEPAGKADGFATLNGKPAILLALEASDDKTADAVRKALAKIELPKDVRVELVADLSEPGFALVEMRLPDAASRVRTETAAAKAAKILRELPGAAHCIAFGGQDANMATLLVLPQVKGGPKLADVRKALSEVREGAYRVTEVSAGARPFPVQLALTDTSGKGAAKLREWSEAVADRIRAEGTALDPGVEPGRTVPGLSITIDPKKLKALGVPMSTVTDTLRVAIGDPYIQNLNDFGKYQLIVPLSANPVLPEDLKKLEVRNDQNQMVRVGTFADFAIVESPSTVLQVNRHNATRITAVPPPGKSVADSVARCIEIAEAEHKRLKLPDGFEVVDLTAANPR